MFRLMMPWQQRWLKITGAAAGGGSHGGGSGGGGGGGERGQLLTEAEVCRQYCP